MFMTREELQRRAEQAKRQIHALASKTNDIGRRKMKLALQVGGASETVARLLINGEYGRNPRQDLVENMEEVVARFGKAKAS